MTKTCWYSLLWHHHCFSCLYFLATNNSAHTPCSSDTSEGFFVPHMMTSPFFISFCLPWNFCLYVISHLCMLIVKMIIFCTIFRYKLGHINEERWSGFEFKEIITMFICCHVFNFFFFILIQGFLDLRFAMYYLVWCQRNRGRGWQLRGALWKTEGCANRIRESEKQRRVGISLA